MGSSNHGVYGYSEQPPKSKSGLPTSYDGVRGEGSGPAANGVYGLHIDSGNFAYLGGLAQAVYGYNSSGNYGYLATDNHGLFGVYDAAVGGESSAGVVGSSVSSAGVRGYSTNNSGIVGYSAGATVPAMAGYSNSGYGALGHAGSTGGMGVVGVQTDHSWSDISIHVFIQVYGDADVYVTNRTSDHFEVRLRDGDPNVEFSYRIMAKRAGYESTRLEHAIWADNDPNLYPERQFEQQAAE